MTRRAARPIKRSGAVDRAPGWPGVINRARISGLLLVVLTAGAVFSLVTDSRFALGAAGGSTDVELSGLGYTDSGAVMEALGLADAGGNNVFLLHTTDIRRRLLDLPSVADAEVRVVLPNRLVVAITERSPVLRVTRGGATYLLDGDGVVLELRAANAPPLPELPLIDDRRVELGIPFEIGVRIDPIEAAAMLQIGALTPALIGSAATTIAFSADDTDGFVVSAEPYGWRAVFGFYTPTLRPPSLIAQQVECLRNLLANGEAGIATIYLAPQGDRCGTYLPRPS
ncbi:MAG: cell division protein FtsQ [Chloroflexota bacterium]|jgi:hypothetical protein|nr:cell division protein FtsQ [Chloroflexota bacterium]